MKLQTYEKIKEEVYSEKLPNGLTILVIPKRGFQKSYAFFATDYGGADRRFRLSGQWKDTPEGVAHFLEHKMFDTKDGNALTMLSENGASPNAFTSSDITAYHFESTDKFEENLRILLSFVSEPYFTEESVSKEQGIIGQEIRMTEDDPDYSVYYNLMKSLYQYNPIRDSVAGTVESIAEITAQTLYDCHKVFYNPSNMVLCVAGDVDPDKIIALASEILPKEPGEVPERDYGGPEKELPEKLLSETSMEVALPLFLAGCKVAPATGRELLRQEMTAELALEILAGHSSPLFLRLYGDGLVNNNFSAAFENSAGASYVMIGGESRSPHEVLNELHREIAAIEAHGADAALFARLKKAALGRKLRELNSFDSICYNQARGSFRGYDAYDTTDVLEAVTLNDVISFIKTNFSMDKLAMSVVNPKQTATDDSGQVTLL